MQHLLLRSFHFNGYLKGFQRLSPTLDAVWHKFNCPFFLLTYSNPNFTFAWLTISDNLAWCAEVMSVDRFGEVTPGIVLALNGHKKYLSIFKPSDLTKTTFFKRQGDDFMGFENSDSETESPDEPLREYEFKRQKVLSASLRREFVTWFEKLLDGLVDRTKIEEWPRFTD